MPRRAPGAAHLAAPAIRAQVPSPFDYPNRTRVLVVRDVRKDDLVQVAAAYRALFEASHGGGLGLFTADQPAARGPPPDRGPRSRPRACRSWPQHVDGLDVSTLVEVFKGDEQACLLGTDAVRRRRRSCPAASLRLIVFDRVPWPRPDLLFRARAEQFRQEGVTPTC